MHFTGAKPSSYILLLLKHKTGGSALDKLLGHLVIYATWLS